MSDEVILTLQINNYEQLNLLLGNEGYYAALVSIHKEIYKFLQKKTSSRKWMTAIFGYKLVVTTLKSELITC
jgi:hypothetical protein